MTFDPSETFETRSNEYQKLSDIHDVNPAFDAANNEHFELSGRDPVLGGKLRERAVWVDERKCIGCTYCSSVATNTFAMEQEQGRARAFRQDGDSDELKQEANAERPEAIEKYELPKLPENVTEDIVNANPMTEWWRNFCWENSYDQEVYQEGINKYVDAYVGQQPDIEAEKSKLGENAEARLDAVNSWASTFFSPEQYEIVSQTMGSNVDGIEALEKVMESQKQNISRAGQVAQPERPLTIEDVRTMMKDKRYYDGRERDPSYVAKVDEAFNRLYRG